MLVYEPFWPSLNKALSLKPAVSEFPKATYFEKLAVPAITGTSGSIAIVSSSLLHATKLIEAISIHFIFFIID